MTSGPAFERAIVDIDWDSSAPPPALRCPITGKVIMYGYDPVTTEVGVDDYQEPDWANIPTVLFHYIGEVGEFDYIRPELQAAIDEKRQAMLAAAAADDVDWIEGLSDFEILSEHLECLGEVPLVFRLTTHGIACGPIHASVHVGLDLAARQGAHTSSADAL